MATVEVLEILPKDHPKRAQLLSNLRSLDAALAHYQNPTKGLWYEVVDKGTLSSNWPETSCSAMFTYTLSKSIRKGYVDSTTYQSVVTLGFKGVQSKISVDSTGLTYLSDICAGTGVGDLNYYLTRPRNTNEFHGLGAYLVLNELMNQ